MRKGKFITFEGCEGSGKSTQLKLLAERLTSEGVDFIITREPGGSGIAEQIRKVILDGKNIEMCDECEALLYAASRVQHVKEKILPALSEGKLVICDRFIHSSLAYQGYARGLGAGYVAAINKKAVELCPPDLTVFLNISPEKAFDRKHGADLNDRMEKQGIDFHLKVYEGYLKLCEEDEKICAVDCGGSKFQTAEKVYNLLKEKGII